MGVRVLIMVKQLISLLLLAASLVPALASAQDAPRPPASPTYLIGPADVLKIQVFEEPSLSGNFSVDSDGTISFPFLNRVPVRGKTLSEVESVITAGLVLEALRTSAALTQGGAWSVETAAGIGSLVRSTSYGRVLLVRWVAGLAAAAALGRWVAGPATAAGPAAAAPARSPSRSARPGPRT